MRRTVLMVSAALAIATGCRASAGERSESGVRGEPGTSTTTPPSPTSLPLPDRRPGDFALQLHFRNGSGMEAPVDLRVEGTTLFLDGAAMRGALTPADLDAIYAAARRLPPAGSRLPPEQMSDSPQLRITLVAAGATFAIDSDKRAIDPADLALLDLLQGRAAAAQASPIELAAKRPDDFTIEVWSDRSQRDARILSVTGDIASARHWGPNRDVSHSDHATAAELDALYAAVRAVAAAGLPPRRGTGGPAIYFRVAAAGQKFESLVDPDSFDAGTRSRVESLRTVADALFDRVDR
jgi:hypothetical protein